MIAVESISFDVRRVHLLDELLESSMHKHWVAPSVIVFWVGTVHNCLSIPALVSCSHIRHSTVWLHYKLSGWLFVLLLIWKVLPNYLPVLRKSHWRWILVPAHYYWNLRISVLVKYFGQFQGTWPGFGWGLAGKHFHECASQGRKGGEENHQEHWSDCRDDGRVRKTRPASQTQHMHSSIPAPWWFTKQYSNLLAFPLSPLLSSFLFCVSAAANECLYQNILGIEGSWCYSKHSFILNVSCIVL